MLMYDGIIAGGLSDCRNVFEKRISKRVRCRRVARRRRRDQCRNDVGIQTAETGIPGVRGVFALETLRRGEIGAVRGRNVRRRADTAFGPQSRGSRAALRETDFVSSV